MSQISDLQKLQEKPRVYPHATQQFIKDGKQTLKSRMFLEEVILKS